MTITQERGETPTFASTAEPADTLHRAAAAHGEHEKRTSAQDDNWPDCTPPICWRSRPARYCRHKPARAMAG